MGSRKKMAKLQLGAFRVKPGQGVRLSNWRTDVPKLYRDDDDAKRQLDQQVQRTSDLQDVLYAGDCHSLLLVFQAMDAAGKDGAIKHVMSGVNPNGCQVYSFKQPSAEELDHDFLWRCSVRLPERGRIGIFNRSWYEEVLVVRVHPELLVPQRLPPPVVPDKRFWQQRYRSIRDYEAHLSRNGTVIRKFFLHVSRDEQRKRFLDRIEHPDKNWKFSMGDVQERAWWSAYMQAYGEALGATSTKDAPWFVVPADDKKNARLIISRILNQTLESLDLKYPAVTQQRRRELGSARRLLRD